MYRYKSKVVHGRFVVCDICDLEQDVTDSTIPSSWNAIIVNDAEVRHVCPKCTREKVIPFIDGGDEQ